MTIDLDTIFRYKVLNLTKLLDNGFSQNSVVFEKEIPIMKKQFNVLVTVQPDGAVSYKVIETAFGDEYILVNVEGVQGSFVGEVRSACEKVLTDISKKCYDIEILKAEQTKRVLAFIKSEYDIEPEFLWEKYPNYAAFRRKDNEKWFAIIMTVDRSKLELSGHGNIEIIDMKAEPDFVERLLKRESYYPAYHMNKKHWFTACLDGSISDEILLSLLSSSYKCSAKR